MNILNIISAFFKLVPDIISTIKKVEVEVPLPQSGQDKLNIILAVVETSYELILGMSGVTSDISKDLLTKGITILVSKIVPIFNKLGLFKTSLVNK